MASHFASIGFDVRSPADLRPLIERAYSEGRSVPAKRGTYTRWEPGGGVQLWLGIDETGTVVSVHPHFAGKALMTVGVTGMLPADPESPLEGAIHGWADGLPETGCYPFSFDSPNFDCLADLERPTLRNVQIAAFADQIAAYRNDKEFRDETAELKIASESFIPLGQFAFNSHANPSSTAAFSGHILDQRTLVNTVHNRKFWSLRIRTYGGIMDIVADPEILVGKPVDGGVVHGSFWLSGMLIE